MLITSLNDINTQTLNLQITYITAIHALMKHLLALLLVIQTPLYWSLNSHTVDNLLDLKLLDATDDNRIHTEAGKSFSASFLGYYVQNCWAFSAKLRKETTLGIRT